MQKVNYDHQAVEEKWLNYWEKLQLFQNTDLELSETDQKLKDYLLFAFAYPSGSGLHVGHVESKTALDILARYKRMNGRRVYFPVGWDAFGLPAENYAIKTGIHPRETTKNAINTFRRQIKRLGISYDWANETATNHPEYYRWTQWIFLQLFSKGLAYQKEGKVNWCPSCQTVLANEQVVNGLCERCDTPVEQKDLKQWYFKITEYQDELIEGLNEVDWPEPTKQQQLNWIGRSEGLKETWEVKDLDLKIESFTTWPHTTWGATFMVVAPEHPVIQELVKNTDYEKEVNGFCKRIINEKAGGAIIKTKEGVFTGRYAINPLTGWEMPIYVANFAIMDYGTGIVKACPAHDERDFEFAKKYDLPIVKVIDSGDPNQEECYVGQGTMVNAGDLTGMSSEDARVKIIKQAVEKGYGEEMIAYKLRDWLISRQRYWGAPIPIVYDPEGKAHPVKEEHLPWTLPDDVDFKPTGESPLKSSREFKARVEKLYGKGWTPEYDTMDTFVDSSWYYLRYCDSRSKEVFADSQRLKDWLPVDLYLIGPEHIVLHLLYSRFFTKFLRDEGYLTASEPFYKMRHQGMILGPDGKKMSKSKGNVINPDTVVKQFGADTLRIYEMFMGPLEADKPWNTRAVAGVSRFLRKIYRLLVRDIELTANLWPVVEENILERQELLAKLHQTIKKVSEDVPALKFNTSIAMLMELANLWEKQAGSLKDKRLALFTPEEILSVVKILAPFAPFVTEELYSQIKYSWNNVAEQTQGEVKCEAPEAKMRRELLEELSFRESIHLESWPRYDKQLAQSQGIVIAVQVNGKLRGELNLDQADLKDKDKILSSAKELESVKKWLVDKELKKEIYVPGKIVSLVVA